MRIGDTVAIVVDREEHVTLDSRRDPFRQVTVKLKIDLLPEGKRLWVLESAPSLKVITPLEALALGAWG